MDEFPRATLVVLAKRFKLLAHPDRLGILVFLCRGERSFAELLGATGLGQANLSRQLGLLDAGGLVARRSEGTRAFWSLADASLPGLCALARRGLESQHASMAAALRPRGGRRRGAPGRGPADRLARGAAPVPPPSPHGTS